jgi:hypothetical protein
VNEPLESAHLCYQGFKGTMIFCQCVKPTVHDYRWAGGSHAPVNRQFPQGKHGPRLPSEKAAETRAHNQAKKAAEKAAEDAKKGVQPQKGGFYGTPGVRERG